MSVGSAGHGLTELPGSTALMAATLLLSPDVLHLPAAGCLGHLQGPEMSPNLPLPLRHRAGLRLPVFRGVQVSVAAPRGWRRDEAGS